MIKMKILFSIIIFSSLLFGTSIIKNETREIEKKILNINKTINLKSKDLIESELDFSYLTSPSILEFLTSQTAKQYVPMKYSKIFLKMDDFLNLENKIVLQNDKNDIILRKNTTLTKQVFTLRIILKVTKKINIYKKQTFLKIECTFYFFYFFRWF